MGRGSADAQTAVERRPSDRALDLVVNARGMLLKSNFPSKGRSLTGPFAMVDVLATYGDKKLKKHPQADGLDDLMKDAAQAVERAQFSWCQAVFAACKIEMPWYPDQPEPKQWELIPEAADLDYDGYEQAFSEMKAMEKWERSITACRQFIADVRDGIQAISDQVTPTAEMRLYEEILRSALGLLELTVDGYANRP